jgi:glycosyltransferase involved in cell wall biosynthesis
MADAGMAVDLLLAERRGPLDGQVPPNVRVVSADQASTTMALPTVARYLGTERPDVLLTSLFEASVVGAVAARLVGAPTKVAHMVHSLPSLKAQKATGGRARLLMRILPAVLRSADALAAVSEAVADDTAAFSGRSRDEIDVIPNPVDIASVREEASKEADHPWLGGELPVIVSVGRLHSVKGHSLLLRAVARLSSQRQVRCIVIGKGARRERLKRLSRQLGIEQCVDFLGYVENPHAIVSQADAFVAPSRQEAFGLAIVEALACGIPVVAAEGPGGIPEVLVDPSGTAYGILAPRQPRHFAEAIDRILERPHDPERLQQRAGHFRVERAVSGYRNLVHRLCWSGFPV